MTAPAISEEILELARQLGLDPATLSRQQLGLVEVFIEAVRYVARAEAVHVSKTSQCPPDVERRVESAITALLEADVRLPQRELESPRLRWHQTRHHCGAIRDVSSEHSYRHYFMLPPDSLLSDDDLAQITELVDAAWDYYANGVSEGKDRFDTALTTLSRELGGIRSFIRHRGSQGLIHLDPREAAALWHRNVVTFCIAAGGRP